MFDVYNNIYQLQIQMAPHWSRSEPSAHPPATAENLGGQFSQFSEQWLWQLSLTTLSGWPEAFGALQPKHISL